MIRAWRLYGLHRPRSSGVGTGMSGTSWSDVGEYMSQHAKEPPLPISPLLLPPLLPLPSLFAGFLV